MTRCTKEGKQQYINSQASPNLLKSSLIRSFRLPLTRRVIVKKSKPCFKSRLTLKMSLKTLITHVKMKKNNNLAIATGSSKASPMAFLSFMRILMIFRVSVSGRRPARKVKNKALSNPPSRSTQINYQDSFHNSTTHWLRHQTLL